MAEHMAMDQPCTRIVENTQYFARISRLNERGITQNGRCPVYIGFPEMVTVKMDTVCKCRLIPQPEENGFTPFGREKRHAWQATDVVESPATKASVRRSAGAALHDKINAL